MPAMPGINSLVASAKIFLGTSWESERWQHSSELTAAGFCLQVIDNQQLGNFFQVTENPDLGRFGSINLNGYQAILIRPKHMLISKRIQNIALNILGNNIVTEESSV